jgi:hypothetical protein
MLSMTNVALNLLFTPPSSTIATVVDARVGGGVFNAGLEVLLYTEHENFPQ